LTAIRPGNGAIFPPVGVFYHFSSPLVTFVFPGGETAVILQRSIRSRRDGHSRLHPRERHFTNCVPILTTLIRICSPALKKRDNFAAGKPQTKL
jgi:hypothetical protein